MVRKSIAIIDKARCRVIDKRFEADLACRTLLLIVKTVLPAIEYRCIR